MQIEIKSIGHHKIAVADILPNPHRDLKINPVVPEKIDDLVKSYEVTGFWDNIVVRKHPTRDGKYQLAYGHNRLAALKDRRVNVEHITIPVAKLTDWQMYEAMVSENELGGRVTPIVAIENVNVGCNLVEAALKKIGKAGTWEAFNEAVGRNLVVPTGTTKTWGGHGFEQVRNTFFNGEGLGRSFLVDFLPCGNMRAATIQEIVASRYGAQKAKVKAAEAERLQREAEKASQAGERGKSTALNKKADKAREDAEQASKNFSQEVLSRFKRARTATDFCKAARDLEIPKSHHMRAANFIIREDINGERMVKSALTQWWANKQEEERDDFKPLPGPKRERKNSSLLVGMQFDADLADINHKIRKMNKGITDHVTTLSEAWVDGTVEELLQTMDRLKQLVDLIRRDRPNTRGHLHVVGAAE